MAIYTDQMFNSDSESTSLADMAFGTGSTTGDYTPARDGTLLKVIVMVGNTSASSLIEAIRIELSNTNWTPNKMMFFVSGDGLHTAPGLSGPRSIQEFVVDQPVTEASKISGQIIHVGGASPVTSNVFVLGVFSG